MRSQMTRFVTDDTGATAIEYALIATGIAMAIVMAVQSVGQQLTPIFEEISQGFGSD